VTGPGNETVSVTLSSFDSNRATATGAGQGGGAIASGGSTQTLDLTGDSLHGDRSAADGGALLNLQATADVQDSQFQDNGAADGGAIGQEGTPTDTATLDLTQSDVSFNRATDEGGGIYASSDSTTALSQSLVDANYAGTAGGGIYNAGTLPATGGYFILNDPDNCAGTC
jgi:hypothetical protein